MLHGERQLLWLMCFFNEMIFSEDGSGSSNINSEGYPDYSFQKNSVFNWTENEAVLTILHFDAIRNNCFGIDFHLYSVYAIAYSCSDNNLRMAGITWVKE